MQLKNVSVCLLPLLMLSPDDLFDLRLDDGFAILKS